MAIAVMYLQANPGGLTLYGWTVDRTLLSTIFAIELSLVLFVLGQTIVFYSPSSWVIYYHQCKCCPVLKSILLSKVPSKVHSELFFVRSRIFFSHYTLDFGTLGRSTPVVYCTSASSILYNLYIHLYIKISSKSVPLIGTVCNM